MLIKAHCFLKKTKITPSPISFELDAMSVSITESPIKEDEGMMLEIIEKIDPEEIRYPKNKNPEVFYFEQLLREYKTKIQIASSLIEGFIAVHYNAPAPTFETSHIITNIIAEDEAEQKMIDVGEVSGGFGDLYKSKKFLNYQWEEKLTENMIRMRSELPALSFLAQATREDDCKETEIAFVLYFRIIEGYFGDGSSHIENALHSNLDKLIKYLPYEKKLQDAFKISLKILRLQSKSDNNYKGMISDLVLLRHKLSHFDNANADRHYQPDLKFNLDLVNAYLRLASIKIILDKSEK